MCYKLCMEIISVSKKQIRTSLSWKIILGRKNKRKEEEERRGKGEGEKVEGRDKEDLKTTSTSCSSSKKKLISSLMKFKFLAVCHQHGFQTLQCPALPLLDAFYLVAVEQNPPIHLAIFIQRFKY